jgi:hypothetical protein
MQKAALAHSRKEMCRVDVEMKGRFVNHLIPTLLSLASLMTRVRADKVGLLTRKGE